MNSAYNLKKKKKKKTEDEGLEISSGKVEI